MVSGKRVFGLFITLVTALALHAAGQTFTVINTFSGSNGAAPLAGLIFDKTGNLYGTTSLGGLGSGVVFELSPAVGGGWTETVLYQFGGRTNDGTSPAGALAFDAAGNLYGTTQRGGAFNAGTIFRLVHTASGWSETILHSFGNGNDGAIPTSGLVMDSAGNGYGTTYYGGVNKNCAAAGSTFSCGTVYQVSPSKTGVVYKTIHNFAGGNDGYFPWAGLTLDGNGNLFGECVYGSQFGKGLLFELSPGTGGAWTEHLLHPWGNKDDGTYIYGGVTFDLTGNMFGVSSQGGAHGGLGTVFEFTPNSGGWLEHNLHGFGTALDGQFSEGNLVVDAADNLFGVTHNGGAFGYGMVYEVSLVAGSWGEKILHNFSGLDDGGITSATMIMDANGNLFGTTQYGGAARNCVVGPVDGCGVVFEITGTGGKVIP